MQTQVIAYYRVSTEHQGRSGLGLDAQRAAVEAYCKAQNHVIAHERIEVESGKRVDRPELLQAISECKKHGYKLVIAKLDRLARNVHFISGLMESGIEFVAVDNPNANRLMLHMLAAFAEYEREMISHRTKDALAAAKARGVELGVNGKALAQTNRIQAQTFAESLAPVIADIRNAGVTTVRAICGELNRRNVPTARGRGQWHIPAVQRLLARQSIAA